MKVELNIGTVVSGGDNSLDARSERFIKASNVLTKMCHTAYIDRRVVHHEGADGSATTLEDTLVAELNTDAMSALDIVQLKGRMFNLAAELQQDCIAMYIPQHDAGELVGPGAAKWGDFNIEFFSRRFPHTELRKAA